MMKRFTLLGLCLALVPVMAMAQTPPSKAPSAPREGDRILQQTVIYDRDGNIVSNFGSGTGGGGGDASAANQQAEIASLGTDGTSPPTVAGTGIRGWLRGIYEKLTGTVAVSATSLPLPTGAAAEATQQGVAASNTAISTATGAKTDAATASGADTSIIGALRAIRDRLLATLTVSTIRATTFSEATNASVGASANLLGSARFVGSPAVFSRFNTAVTSSQAGTLFVQGSNDAAFTVPVTLASVAVTAGQFANASVPVVLPYNRAYLFNGSTAATATLSTSYTAN